MSGAANRGVYHLGNSRDLDTLIKKAGDARIVLLGEASHGTHEYYIWRAAITRRLVEEKGFSIIAVEGDWPDCYKINRYVKGYDHENKKADEVLSGFQRWPTWMWANWEIAGMVEWLKEHNAHQKIKTGFYGLDVYSLWESMEVLTDYLSKNDPGAAHLAKRALSCFEGIAKAEQEYASNSIMARCKDEVITLLREVRQKARNYNHDPEAELNTLQNAHIAVEAEKYYSKMLQFDGTTWNIRDRHMMETLGRLLDFHGDGSKIIVWAHNSHVGDANHTSMASEGLFNLGQLVREQYPGKNYIVGFGSYSGTVMAASVWGANIQEMEMPVAAVNSFEEELHSRSDEDRYLLFDEFKDDTLTGKKWPHRAVGVVYDPANEKDNYVSSQMNRRYDAFIFLDDTTALHPLPANADPELVPDTYPFEF